MLLGTIIRPSLLDEIISLSLLLLIHIYIYFFLRHHTCYQLYYARLATQWFTIFLIFWKNISVELLFVRCIWWFPSELPNIVLHERFNLSVSRINEINYLRRPYLIISGLFMAWRGWSIGFLQCRTGVFNLFGSTALLILKTI